MKQRYRIVLDWGRGGRLSAFLDMHKSLTEQSELLGHVDEAESAEDALAQYRAQESERRMYGQRKE